MTKYSIILCYNPISFVTKRNRAKLAKRAQWAKQRARFGAAVKIFKALCRRIFWAPQETSPERKVFYPLQFAPANAVPLTKGTKVLHQKNGDFDFRPPSFGPTAVFNLHFFARPFFGKTFRSDGSFRRNRQNMAFGALIKKPPLLKGGGISVRK